MMTFCFTYSSISSVEMLKTLEGHWKQYKLVEFKEIHHKFFQRLCLDIIQENAVDLHWHSLISWVKNNNNNKKDMKYSWG